jgi:hypothetical protein
MDERQWFYVKDGQRCGPVAEGQLIELLGQGALPSTTQVWTKGLADWQKASEIAGLVPSGAAVAGTAAMQPMPQAVQAYGRIRPTSVTVFGVLNIVFGVLSLVCTPVALAATFLPAVMPNMPDMPKSSDAAQAWSVLCTVIGVAFAVVELAAGVGLLNLKAWGRKLSVAFGWLTIVWVIVGTGVNLALVFSGAFGYTHEQTPAAVGGMCFGVFGLIYPILLIIFMHRPAARNACVR